MEYQEAQTENRPAINSDTVIGKQLYERAKLLLRDDLLTTSTYFRYDLPTTNEAIDSSISVRRLVGSHPYREWVLDTVTKDTGGSSAFRHTQITLTTDLFNVPSGSVEFTVRDVDYRDDDDQEGVTKTKGIRYIPEEDNPETNGVLYVHDTTQMPPDSLYLEDSPIRQAIIDELSDKVFTSIQEALDSIQYPVTNVAQET